jgi:Phosphotransferase enzyme family
MSGRCGPAARLPDGREILLHGGTANRGQVVRVGDTVRRPRRSTSPATHALLRHLADVGFDGAPRFLGVDGQGREVLSYLPGTPVVPPYPEWALTDEALVSVAHLLRAYHRAVATFDPAPHAWPPSPPAPFVDGLVSHNDLNLDNVIFRDGRAAALIDFDLASPGSRLWDVACAARLWAPLRPDTAIHDARRGRALDRFGLFVESYGVPDADRPRVVEAVGRNHRWFRDLIRNHAEEGHAVFAEHWNPEARERARQHARWLDDNAPALRAALGPRQPNHRQADTTPKGR